MQRKLAFLWDENATERQEYAGQCETTYTEHQLVELCNSVQQTVVNAAEECLSVHKRLIDIQRHIQSQDKMTRAEKKYKCLLNSISGHAKM